MEAGLSREASLFFLPQDADHATGKSSADVCDVHAADHVSESICDEIELSTRRFVKWITSHAHHGFQSAVPSRSLRFELRQPGNAVTSRH
jgi:hypothetical protein